MAYLCLLLTTQRRNAIPHIITSVFATTADGSHSYSARCFDVLIGGSLIFTPQYLSAKGYSAHGPRCSIVLFDLVPSCQVSRCQVSRFQRSRLWSDHGRHQHFA